MRRLDKLRFTCWLPRLWPRRLTGQIIALLLGALVLAQVTSFLVLMDEREATRRSIERTEVAERTAALVRLIESSPSSLHDQIVHAASSRKLYFWLSDTGPISERAFHGMDGLRRRIQLALGDNGSRELWVTSLSPTTDRSGASSMHPVLGLVESDAFTGRSKSVRDSATLLISVRLHDGRWLNAGLGVYPPFSRWAVPSLISMALAITAISVIAVTMVRRTTKPLARLAEAAEHLGRGDVTGPIAEDGPLDVRQTIRAFNEMNHRLQRFIQDRTSMLAAISHDLRTPITCARLRADLIEDDENRKPMLGILDEMQRMIEATLAFTRDDAETEKSREVDLAALIDSVCCDLSDAGMDVAFEDADRTTYNCQSLALRRALRNLVENAVHYGRRARVRLERSDGQLRVVISDEGPGIPESDYERVFQPFVRLEGSRSRETGGVGLGMPIARSIVRKHGGDIALGLGGDGRFCVSICLPIAKC